MLYIIVYTECALVYIQAGTICAEEGLCVLWDRETESVFGKALEGCWGLVRQAPRATVGTCPESHWKCVYEK